MFINNKLIKTDQFRFNLIAGQKYNVMTLIGPGVVDFLGMTLGSLDESIFGFLYAIFVQRRILPLSAQNPFSYTQTQCSFMTRTHIFKR